MSLYMMFMKCRVLTLTNLMILVGNGGAEIQQTNFEGCISQLSVGQVFDIRPIQLDSALQGQSVTQCTN